MLWRKLNTHRGQCLVCAVSNNHFRSPIEAEILTPLARRHLFGINLARPCSRTAPRAQPNVWRPGSSNSSKSLLGRSIDLAAKHARTWKWRPPIQTVEPAFAGSQHHLSATRPANSAAPSATKFWTCFRGTLSRRSGAKPDANVNMDQLTHGKPAVSGETAPASMLRIRAVMLGIVSTRRLSKSERWCPRRRSLSAFMRALS